MACSVLGYALQNELPMKASQLEIGKYIKERVLPKGLTVKQAAEQLGVSRPNFSRILNGHVQLSPQMATRLEKAFGVSAQELLKMQAQMMEADLPKVAKDIHVPVFTPSFCDIQSSEIENFFCADSHRPSFPSFVRKLIIASSQSLKECDFPGGDDFRIHGLDGFVVEPLGSLYVPQGTSVWEVGTNEDAEKKANDDYEQRLQLSLAERRERTFVFVTPRRAERLRKWEIEKNASSDWKAVKVIDGPRLAQWLDITPCMQVWLKDQMNQSLNGVRTLETMWKRWEASFAPAFNPSFFDGRVRLFRGMFETWLNRNDGQILTIRADSTDEALAFIYCLCNHADSSRWQSRALYMTNADTASMHISAGQDFLYITDKEEVEREFVPIKKACHFIVIRYCIEEDSSAIDLGPVSQIDFMEALKQSGVTESHAGDLYRKSGASLTLLRRLMCVNNNQALLNPVWSKKRGYAKLLVVAALLGVFHEESRAEIQVWSELSGLAENELLDQLQDILEMEDSPLWRSGKSIGVKSKFDVLSRCISKRHDTVVKQFYSVASRVLASGHDMYEGVHEGEEWYRSLEWHSDFSQSFQRSICISMILLDEYYHVWQMSCNIEDANKGIFQSCFPSFDWRKIGQCVELLPYLAEAAPDTFLDALDADIKLGRDKSSVISLLSSREQMFMHFSEGHYLIRALEILAWKKEFLGKCAHYLALMQTWMMQMEIKTSISPSRSLFEIFCAEFPQTQACAVYRNQILDSVLSSVEIESSIVWDICMQQFPVHGLCVDVHASPKYRPWNTKRENFSSEISESLDYAYRIISSPEGKTVGFWSALVDRLSAFEPSRAHALWKNLEQWANCASKAEKMAMLEELRGKMRHRFAEWCTSCNMTKASVIALCDALEPTDLVERYTSLFNNEWTSRKVEDSNADYDLKLQNRWEERENALQEIVGYLGVDGVVKLISVCAQPVLVGRALVRRTGHIESFEFVFDVFSKSTKRESVSAFVCGITECLSAESYMEFLQSVRDVGLSLEMRQEAYLAMWPTKALWQFLEAFESSIERDYWRKMSFGSGLFERDSQGYYVHKMLEFNRPWACFIQILRFSCNITAKELFDLMRALPAAEQDAEGMSGLMKYELAKMFALLRTEPSIPRADIAKLEFFFAPVLENSQYSFCCLQEILSSSPEMFMDLLRRKCDAEVELQQNIAESEQSKIRAFLKTVNAVFRRWTRIPGQSNNGADIDANVLKSWYMKCISLSSVTQETFELEYWLGDLLGKSHLKTDGVWPLVSLREFIEDCSSDVIFRQMIMGRVNAFCGQCLPIREHIERDNRMAEKCREDGNELASMYPKTSKMLYIIADHLTDSASRYKTRLKQSEWENL